MPQMELLGGVVRSVIEGREVGCAVEALRRSILGGREMRRVGRAQRRGRNWWCMNLTRGR
jgi:hypothetical protein